MQPDAGQFLFAVVDAFLRYLALTAAQVLIWTPTLLLVAYLHAKWVRR